MADRGSHVVVPRSAAGEPRRIVGRGLVQKGNPYLISVAPHHLGPDCDLLFAHLKVETAWQDRCPCNHKPSAVLGHISDQAVDGGKISVKANRRPEKSPPALCFASIKHDQRSQFETYGPINNLFSNLRTVAANALDTGRAV